MKLTPISRYMALLLRHHPEQAGITLDEHGWAHVDELIKGIQKKISTISTRDIRRDCSH